MDFGRFKKWTLKLKERYVKYTPVLPAIFGFDCCLRKAQLNAIMKEVVLQNAFEPLK